MLYRCWLFGGVGGNESYSFSTEESSALRAMQVPDAQDTLIGDLSLSRILGYKRM